MFCQRDIWDVKDCKEHLGGLNHLQGLYNYCLFALEWEYLASHFSFGSVNADLTVGKICFTDYPEALPVKLSL